jgi:hypothetical protein
MPLPIRDGNQSLTTLSTILVSNSHIPAHTVVSFGTQGITDIATAVSGVELGPNTLNALENITVTLGQVTITGGLTDAQLRASAVTIGGSVTATISGTASVTFSQASVTFGTAVVTGSTSILNFPATQTVTFSQAPVTFGLISGTVTANPTGTQTIAGSVTLGAGTEQIGSVTASGTVTANIGGIANSVTLPVRLFAEKYGESPSNQDTLVVCNSNGMLLVDANVSGTSVLGFDGNAFVQVKQVSGSSVTIGNSLTISSLPAISGTVTAQTDFDVNSGLPCVAVAFDSIGGVQRVGINNAFPIRPMQDGAGNTIPLAISGTVTIGSALPAGTNRIGVVTIGAGTVTIGAGTAQIGSVTASISGTVTANLGLIGGFSGGVELVSYSDDDSEYYQVAVPNAGNPYIPTRIVGGTVTIGSLPAISGTVTANLGTAVVQIVNAIKDGDGLIFGLDRNFPISGTVTVANIQGGTSTISSFTSTTPSTTLFSAVAGRKVATVFNEGAGNLHIAVGGACTTIGYQVRLSAGDYWEAPLNQTALLHTAVFATAGTARLTQVS